MAEDQLTVIVDDLHVVYRVYGTGAGRGNAVSAFRRVLKGQHSPVLRDVHAVRGISFVARRGEAIGIIGRNGSGKSTMLRAIAGLLPAEKGVVYTDGQPSLLGVNAALMNDLTGERNVYLGCLAMGMSMAEVKEKYDEIVDFAGIGDFISLPMRTYSSGMGARLRFAIASAKQHNILMIDEALATGDAQFRKKSEKRIEELRENAGTVFLVSHSLDVVKDTCSRALWVDKGTLVMDGPADEVVGADQGCPWPPGGRRRRARRPARPAAGPAARGPRGCTARAPRARARALRRRASSARRRRPRAPRGRGCRGRPAPAPRCHRSQRHRSLCSSRAPRGAHSGMFPCFFGGRLSRLPRRMRSALAISARVCEGSMTASTKPRSAAMYGVAKVSSYSVMNADRTASTSLPSACAALSALRCTMLTAPCAPITATWAVGHASSTSERRCLDPMTT